jgi:hypothetical protein
MSRPALRPTQPLKQWIVEAVSSGIKWQGREPDHLHQVARFRMVELYLYSPVQLHDVIIN